MEPKSGFLICDVDREVKRRLLIDLEQIKEFEKIFLEIHESNVGSADSNLSKFIDERFPTIEVKVTDGASYKVKNTEELIKIRTSPKRRLEKISIQVWGDTLKASLSLGERFGNSASLSVEGPEDKAEHYANKLYHILTEKQDYTVAAAWVPTFFLALIIPALIAASIIVLIDRFGSVTESQATVILTILMIGGFSMVFWLAFYLEHLKERWLPRVSFLWGYGERQHQVAKNAVKAIFFSFPVWLASLFLPALF